MTWKLLLSTLRMQTPLLTAEDFLLYSGYEYLLNYPEKLFFDLSPGKLKNYISENPFWFKEGYRIIEWCNKNNADVLLYGEPDYPKEFYLLNDPPLILSYQGLPVWKNRNMLSVVGSRHPSPKSLDWMDQHLAPLVREGLCLVSGAARGIDQRAHLISIRNKTPTVAFLPAGLDQIYPKEFSVWRDKITDHGGALVSEYSPFQSMRKHHFLERNRMIARLGRCLLVVEARAQSGSSMTARLAIENSQSVCVLPAFPNDQNFRGSVDLLFTGAFPIRDAIDLKQLMDISTPELGMPNFSK